MNLRFFVCDFFFLNFYFILELFSHSVMSDSLWPHGLQHARFPYPSPSPGACSDSYLLSLWCHSTISSSVVPVSCLQSFPASVQFNSVQSLSCVWLFATPWTIACQASLSINNSQSSPKPTSIVSVMPSNHLILCHHLLLLPSMFPSIRVFSNESALHIRWSKIGISASTSVLPMNTQDWSPLGWTVWISLQSKGLSRVFSNTTFQKHQFFHAQLSL